LPLPTAATANGMASSPHVVPSPALHAAAVGNTAPSNSSRPPPQPIPPAFTRAPSDSTSKPGSTTSIPNGLTTPAHMAHYNALQAGQNPNANVTVQLQVPGRPMYYVEQS